MLAHKLTATLLLSCAGLLTDCAQEQRREPYGSALPAPQSPRHFAIRGAWLAPRDGFPLDSKHGTAALAHLAKLGVRQVAIGCEVGMPAFEEPHLEWGRGDGSLRRVLRAIAGAGMEVFLMPRIESPDFFKPPYPFRADIDFADESGWSAFHSDMERMILHYAKLSEAEGVALFGLGLELKHSIRKYPDRWRDVIRKVRGVYRGKITYSANWYDEWKRVTFWDDLDFIGVGAYFELTGNTRPGTASVRQLVERWDPSLRELEAASKRFARPVLFTEVGYTGYVDCAERPWEWAGKQSKGVAIDHGAQARALAALFRVVASHEYLAGLFVWSFYTDYRSAAPWEYSIQGRPAEAEVELGYRLGR